MPVTVVWFRDDLRIADHEPLVRACARGAVVGLVLPPDAGRPVRPLAPARQWWTQMATRTLEADLRTRGIPLLCRWHGSGLETLLAVARDYNADAVFWHRRLHPVETTWDDDLAIALRQRGLWVEQFSGALLHNPLALAREHGGPYRVFTPFWRRVRQLEPPVPLPVPQPRASLWPNSAAPEAAPEPRRSPVAAAAPWSTFWIPSEAAAQQQLSSFVARGLREYRTMRDTLGTHGTSHLSPYLAHGQLTPRQIWHAVQSSEAPAEQREAYLRQLAWREFAYHILVHAPDLHARNWRAEFDAFPWQRNGGAWLEQWQGAKTGIPLVDAAMRQLAATGWMHNRARMVVASWLTKNLFVHWTLGENWFWQTLVDADAANNPFGWQWVAGCGADAAPYFRVFQPVRQGERFDDRGTYVRRWLPELAAVPDAYIHRPWTAPRSVLERAGVELGKTYPRPIVDPDRSRQAALEAFARLRRGHEPT